MRLGSLSIDYMLATTCSDRYGSHSHRTVLFDATVSDHMSPVVSSELKQGALRRRTDGRSLRPSLNLLAAALAGAVNQAFTLPLENITTRMQTSSSSTTTMKNPGPLTTSGCRTIITTAATGEGNSGAGRNVNSGVGGQRTEDDEKSEGSGDEAVTERYCEGGGEVGEEAGRHRANSSSNSDLAPPADGIIGIHRKGSELSGGLKLRHTPPRLPSPPPPPPLDSHEHQQYPSRRRVPRQDGRRQSVWTVARELYIEEGKGVARFWRGFAPSLILTCNPAINYTAFDFLKALWLRRRVASDPMGNNGAGPDATKVGAEVSGGSVSVPRGRAVGGDFLNPVEAFFIAAAAKSLATLVTYPLIRAKVILMTSPSLSSSSLSSSSTTREACVVERKRKDDVNNDEAQQSGEQTARTGDQLLGHVVTDDRNDRSITHAGAAISPAATAPAGAAAAGPATAAGIPSLVTASSGTGPEGNMTLERIVVVMDTDGDLTATEKETRRYRGGVRQMGGVIVRIVRHDGVRGLYSGCGAQVGMGIGKTCGGEGGGVPCDLLLQSLLRFCSTGC